MDNSTLFLKLQHIILTLLLLVLPSSMAWAQGNRSVGGANNSSRNSQSSNSNNDDEDPCVDFDDQRTCWLQDPITGIRYAQVPDTSHINLANRQTMPSKSLGLVYTGNLFSPHLINNIFDRRDSHDFMFVNAYSLFAYRPEDLLFYDTRMPFTNVAYSTSGSSTTTNDHFIINFAGNLNKKLGIGTFLDYVYARGEYISSATKPLKWSSYIYYDEDRYKATLTFNISKLANQENGGIEDSTFVINPDIQKNNTLTDPHTMPTNLEKTWNDMDTYQLHFNHSYELGRWDEQVNPEDSTDVWDEFTSVASIFHSLDLQGYDHTFIVNDSKDLRSKFFKNHYYSPTTTQDSTQYHSFTTYAGIRVNEGFSKWSQFGLSAFVGYEHQEFKMKDSLNHHFDFESHKSDNVFIGGQLSRHQSSFLQFDATAKVGVWGDKKYDLDLSGNLRTIIHTGTKDSIFVQASGFIRNTNVPYMLRHFRSNHFRWDNNNFKSEKRVHVEGKFRYSLTGTEAKVGIEHISNYHYFNVVDFKPRQSKNKIEVISAEFTQQMHWKAIHFDNRVLLQTNNHPEELPMPKIVWESDLSLRFVIAHTLHTQMGITGYYHTKYRAPLYQPATQQFAVQDYVDCGGFPLFNGYVNCNLKRMKFYIMYNGFGSNLFSNDVFIMPKYSLQSPRIEYGVVVDLQD